MSFGNVAQSVNRGISNVRDSVNERANALLSPKTAEGISGFVFDIADTESLSIRYDVTDHYTEDNSFIQDHIVKKPIEVTLSGFIGELVFRGPTGVEAVAQALQNRLETVEAYLGDYTPGGVQVAQNAIGQAQSAVNQINNTLDRVQNVIGLLDGEGPEETAQERAYAAITSLIAENTIVTVQTPWKYFESMIITSVSLRQGGESRGISDISVSLKEFRTAKVGIVDFDINLFRPSREEVQASETVDQGNARGEEELVSALFASRDVLR